MRICKLLAGGGSLQQEFLCCFMLFVSANLVNAHLETLQTVTMCSLLKERCYCLVASHVNTNMAFAAFFSCSELTLLLIDRQQQRWRVF